VQKLLLAGVKFGANYLLIASHMLFYQADFSLRIHAGFEFYIRNVTEANQNIFRGMADACGTGTSFVY
jgi:hypothetical protein